MKISHVSAFTPALFEEEQLAPNQHYVWQVTCTDGTVIPMKIRDLNDVDKTINILCRISDKMPASVEKDMTVHDDAPKYKDAGGMDSHERGEYHRQQNKQYDDNKRQGTNYESIESEVHDKYLAELSVGKMSQYRDATANPRATDRLGKVVKHTRGHNQAVNKIAKATGDNTPNKDYARTVEGEKQLNELTNELLGKYKKAAGADASKSDKAGNTAQADKRFSGIVKATKKQFANDAKPVEEDFNTILGQQHKDAEAAKSKPKTVDIQYHGWVIRYRPAAKTGEQVAWQVQDKKGEVKFRSQSGTDKDAVQDAEAWINKGGDAKQAATSNVTIDFNVDFAKEFAPEGDNFYAAIDSDNGTPMLILSLEQQQGFKKSHIRTQAHKQTAGTTRLPAITMTAKEANAVGLQANGRYMLGAKDEIDQNTAMFPLIFQSIVQGKGDMMKMGKPGLTVAHNRD